MKQIANQKDDRQERTCTRKIRLRSIAKAKAAIRSIRSINGRCDVEAYHCQFCGGWHLGNHASGNKRIHYKKLEK